MMQKRKILKLNFFLTVFSISSNVGGFRPFFLGGWKGGGDSLAYERGVEIH